jgi:hypothetical protein
MSDNRIAAHTREVLARPRAPPPSRVREHIEWKTASPDVHLRVLPPTARSSANFVGACAPASANIASAALAG